MMIPPRHRALASALLLAATLTGCAGPDAQAGTPRDAAGQSAGPAPTSTFRSRLPHDTSGTPTKGCRPDRPMPSQSMYQGMDLYGGDDVLQSVLQSIQEAGESRFPNSYAGTEIVQDRGEGAVYRVPDTEFDAFVTQTSGDVCLYLRDARFNAATLDALGKRIVADFAYWEGRGLKIRGVFFGGGRGEGLKLGVAPEDVAEARIELPKRYGAEIPILVEAQELAEAS
ncbi:hypothetical protein [Catellatospora chokoriensis]|nr:hypothetical protein [Catellatospora chokoriensis]